MVEGPEKDNGDQDLMEEPTAADFLVVGIGASAGGIRALKDFFANVPADSGNAYVVILHLSPEHESHLPEVLQANAAVPVYRVNDGPIKVEPDAIYVISPNSSLQMSDGTLTAAAITNYEERRAPVDIFFRTLAESKNSSAVSVVLSGTGPDGSMGIKRVKEMGGVVIAQDPVEAEYSDMPRNTIATGLVDYVLPAAEIPRKINEYKSNLGKVEISIDDGERPDISDETALFDIFLTLRSRTGHDFINYKRASVLRRIERRMNVNHITLLHDYADFVKESRDEAHALLKDLLISVTNFFRDRTAFEYLEREIAPKILHGKKAKDAVRIWVAGCASGEEAYSIAMIFAEQVKDNPKAPTIQIFGTDIDVQAIATARQALYSAADVADVSPERLKNFFTEEGNSYRVRRELREMMLFANHNVTKDPPFSRLDLFTCRNLLIYLNRAAQRRVMETAHFALKAGGYVFVGASETADAAEDLFEPVSKEYRIYQRRTTPSRLSLPLTSVVPTAPLGLRHFTDVVRNQELQALERMSYTALHQQLLEQYAPPSVVVNHEYDVLHMSDNAGRYMKLAGGEPSRNLLNIARPELRLELRTALYQSMQRRAPVRTSDIRVKTDTGYETVSIQVRPAIRDEDPEKGYLLVLFEPATDAKEDTPPRIAGDEPLTRHLEEELIETKSQLRATIEQYEIQHEELRASNEELQAINEELRSAVEEVETGKEETQSVNEELSTVNQELRIKIEELSQSNNDLQNLINSTQVGTIFLDRKLKVRLYTVAATDIFSLIPADIGRPLSDLTSKLKLFDLADDARSVLASLQPIEKEIKADEGKLFMMRILPYRTKEDRIEGVVVTFVDITRRLAMERELLESSDRMNEVINGIADAFYALDANWNFIFVNRTTYEWTERREGTLIGKNIWEEFPQSVGGQSYEMHQRAMAERKIVHFETDSLINGRRFDVSLYPDDRGGLSCYFRDITDRHEAETLERLREQQLRMVLESTTEYAIFTTDGTGRVTSWNSGAEQTFGYASEEMVGQIADILFTPDDRRGQEPKREMETALETGRSEDERWHVRKDGSQFWASGVMQPLRTDGSLAGFVKICRDQTDKLAAEGALRERGMLKRLVSAQEEERQRIARDLHDQLGQQLTALRLKLEGLKASYGAEPAMIKAIDETQEQAKKIDDEVSFMAWELRPTALDNLGLRNALGNFVQEWSKNFGIPAEFHSARSRRTRLVPEIEINLYRIAQEALNNVLKHAKASKVDVLLEYGKDDVVLMVEDDGTGFNVKSRSVRKDSGQGLGIIGMRERAALLGGTLEIESAKGSGTTILARIPMRFVEARPAAGKGN